MKKARRRIDVNLEELDRVLDGARQAPLSEADHGKLKDTLHALAGVYCENGQNACKLLLICMLLCHSCITHVGYYRADQGPGLESVSAASGFV